MISDLRNTYVYAYTVYKCSRVRRGARDENEAFSLRTSVVAPKLQVRVSPVPDSRLGGPSLQALYLLPRLKHQYPNAQFMVQMENFHTECHMTGVSSAAVQERVQVCSAA